MGDAIIVTARDMEIMEEEGEAFIEDVFDEWTRGHFGKRLDRELGETDGTSSLREAGLGEAAQIVEDSLSAADNEALLGEVPTTTSPATPTTSTDIS